MDVERPPPKIAVITPTYNRADLLMRAVASVRSQTMEAFEMIVVDDGSTDDTLERLEALSDPRIRCLRQEHKGAALARNLGAASASAEILTFLDSDDEAHASWLASLLAPFNAPEVGIVCAGFREIDTRNGTRTETIHLPRHEGPLYEHQVVMFMGGAFALRKGIFDAVGGYTDQAARQQRGAWPTGDRLRVGQRLPGGEHRRAAHRLAPARRRSDQHQPACALRRNPHRHRQ